MAVPGDGADPVAAGLTSEAEGVATSDALVEGAPDANLDVTTPPDAEASAGDDAPILSEADAADEADLATYPEAVRDDFKALSPAKRKALYEEAEKRAEARITANQERTARLEAEQKAQEARRAEIRARTGKHVGAEAQTLTLPNGNTVELPSYDEMVTLSTTQRGRDQLAEKYGLADGDAEFWRFFFEQNRAALDASADQFDDAAWGKLDGALREGIKAHLGVEPDTILAGAQSPLDVVKGIAGHFEGQIAQLKKEHEARADALNANAEGMRGRVLAATSRGPATGGRSGGTSTALTPERYRAMTTEERMALTSAERDAILAPHLAQQSGRR